MKKIHKGVIRLHDTTDHGGEVITASSNSYVEGRPIARVGDLVTCPKCRGTHTIIEGDPEVIDQRRRVAFDGHKASCGATLLSSVK